MQLSDIQFCIEESTDCYSLYAFGKRIGEVYNFFDAIESMLSYMDKFRFYPAAILFVDSTKEIHVLEEE